MNSPLSKDEAMSFCQSWLSAWTGNRPEHLLSFYNENVFYRDPAQPQGLRGHSELRPYFTKLLQKNPDWIWEAVEVILTEKGFILKWKATLPVGEKTLFEHGLDIVEIENQKIIRNEVYFDRSALMLASRGTSSNH